MREAVIVSGARTAVGKAPRGSLRTTRPDDLAAVAIKAALARAPGLDPAEIDDIILGCAIPEAEQGMNVGRIAALKAGLPNTVPGQTVNRFCSSGLQTIALAAQQIMSGMGDVIVAGGDLSAPAWVPETYVLDLEREAFLSLLGEAKTQARIAHMLQTGKPLRN